MNDPDLLLPSGVQAAPIPEVRNHTPYPSQYFQMLDTHDEAFHVIASRLTYDLTRVSGQGFPELAKQQAPLVDADQFYGEPTTSSCIQESDFAPFKPRCDIVLAHATAHTPDGKPHQRWPVGVRVGDWQKVLHVTGPRHIQHGLLGWKVGEPAKALEVPLRWENAYGGTCHQADPEPDWKAYEANPIGCGWLDKDWLRQHPVNEMPAPQLEMFNQPFDSNAANAMRYPAVGLGPVGKWWMPRRAQAGTYDQAWKETRWPRLPQDFDFGYWNAAPQDQQIAYPQGGEDIALIGFKPGGQAIQCLLPQPALHAILRMQIGPIVPLPMRLDTLVFDLQAMTLSCVYRIQVAAQFGARVLELRPGQAPL